MKNSWSSKLIAPILVVFLFYGCAARLPKSEITPKLYSGTEKNITAGVIEARRYVLSGEKGPRFEGIYRDDMGIPISFLAPSRPGEEPFASFLSGMIKDGLSDAGANVSVVSFPMGSSVEDAWKKMSGNQASRFILLRVNESNWDDGMRARNPTYKYDFGLMVAGEGGKVIASKNLSGTRSPQKGKQHPLDTYSLTYRSLIEAMFSDPEIKQALGN